MKLVLSIVLLGLVFTKSVFSANLACGATSTLKTITIESPAIIPTECVYTIKPTSVRICQLRVVLEEFNLAPPTSIGNGHPTCRYDIFAVSGLRLCGVNNNQHFYITSTDAKQVIFSILLASRVTNPTFTTPKWKMTITQLECPAGILGRSALSSDVVPTLPDTLNDLTMGKKAVVIPDGYYLAPIGCLQYYPDVNGTIESFNLNTNVGPYFSDFQYAICFARGASTSFVRLIPIFFKMGNSLPNGDGVDSSCFSEIETIGRQEDYLFIPFATLPNGRRGTRFCGTSLADTTVDIRPPGPFVINVVSDDNYNSETDVGFKFFYQIL